MTDRRFRTLALAALSIGMVMTSATGARAVTNVSDCGTLDKLGEVYRVTQDLTSCGTCLVIANNRITVNLQTHTITGTCDGAGITDDGVARDLTTVRDGFITGFDTGVDLAESTRSQVLNMNTTDAFVGIIVGPSGLVKSSTAMFNVFGIVADERGQVQNSDASFNFLSGIVANDHCLITQNKAASNGEEGIATGGSCTVSFNVTANNEDDGIDVGYDGAFDGRQSLVTGNTSVNNADRGIEVPCPSTVTFNTASGNFLNYDLFGAPPACQAVGNKEIFVPTQCAPPAPNLAQLDLVLPGGPVYDPGTNVHVQIPAFDAVQQVRNLGLDPHFDVIKEATSILPGAGPFEIGLTPGNSSTIQPFGQWAVYSCYERSGFTVAIGTVRFLVQ